MAFPTATTVLWAISWHSLWNSSVVIHGGLPVLFCHGFAAGSDGKTGFQSQPVIPKGHLLRHGKSVHHPSSSSGGSFFLLETFRRYTFWLTEDSVALALQSCLGGSAPRFHVKFQNDCHFRFSVSCKAVSFAIYRLKHFIGSCFDVYFHL